MKIGKINKFLQFFLGKEVTGVTLYPFGIFIREDYMNDAQTINHEKIHWNQQVEMKILGFVTSLTFLIVSLVLTVFDINILNGLLLISSLIFPFLLFYIWYVFEWAVKIFKFGPKSYFHISFEKEAYKWQSCTFYLIGREPFSWFKYIWKE